MSKKAIDNGVDNLSTLDPTVVLEMLSRVPPPLINQLAEAQGVKTYIIKSIIIEAKKWQS